MEDLVVIGGGPAGIMAAITASGKDKKIIIIDKNPSLGKKILSSGNGKCNITNSDLSADKYCGDKNFLKKVFAGFDNKNLISFFEKRGVMLKTESFGRVLPVTETSASILDCLSDELVFCKVAARYEEQVLALVKNPDSFTVKTGRSSYETKNVLIAAGNCAYPQFGAGSDGCKFAEKLGHTIIPLRPALVPPELSGNWFQKLQGVRVEAELQIRAKGGEKKYNGELLFTKYGISGPVTLDASLGIIDGIKNNAEIFINFLPLYRDFIGAPLNAAWDFRPEKTIFTFLSGFLPKKIALILLPLLGVNISKKCKELTKKERENIINSLLKWPVAVKGPKSYKEAMVAAGGVATDEINAETMESKKVPGLFFAGEVLDITGESGGYNIQFAFSSGYIAGTAVKNRRMS
ncbi:MAG: NAD(P)/FAD-dependent oxidoreductase [Candidatus Firestonebacteria bacterium]